MELKVWVEGIQRIVCGVSDKTTCQDVVYALAHATGKTGRFTLIERWRNNERLLAPQEHPLKVLAKWGEYSNDVQFILQRSPLDNNKATSSPQLQRSKNPGVEEVKPEGSFPSNAATQPPSQVKKSHTFSGQLHHQSPAAIWKSPPTSGSKHPPPVVSSISTGNIGPIKNPVSGEPARLSPDSGRGSDPTGSDTSNFSDQEKALALSGPRSSHPPAGFQAPSQGYPHPSGYLPQGVLPSGYQPQGWPDPYRHGGRFHSQSPDRGGDHGYGYTKPRSGSNPPPAYRPPPHPGQGSHARNSSPADPPPYRNPPPPPGSSTRHHAPMPTSPTMGRQAPPSPSRGGLPPPHPSPKLGRHMPHSPTPPKSHQFVRPHYSPPPHHRDIRGHPRGLSPGRSLPNRVSNSPNRGPQPIQQSPTRGHSTHGTHGWGVTQPNALRPSPSGDSCNKLSMQQDGLVPTTDNYVDLINLVSVQQTRLQSQHAEIKHCDNELSYWDRGLVGGYNGNNGSSSGHTITPTSGGHVPQSVGPGRPWAGQRPEPPPSQLEAVVTEVKRLEDVAVKNEWELTQLGVVAGAACGEQEGSGIRTELDQLKNRLEITDLELQKTNVTLRRLGDEMRSFSQEKSRQVEAELKTEVERIQAEIKLLQKSSEEGANISEKLHKEVQDVENQISARKAEVEKLIQDMKSANLESLTISPPDENKAFLDGPSKPGTTRKMLGSPRQLENAVPTSKNPHGVWV